MFIVDGNNVMGSRPDGWWNDRPKAMARLAQEVAVWCRNHDDDVLLVFDGQSHERVTVLGGGNLTIRFTERSARNAADDLIVEVVRERLESGQARPGERTVVVTADRGLRSRLDALEQVTCEGPKLFLERLAAS